ncbi:MAG: hypothetical protein R3224_10860 [Balneolaceae bacterium]|nr:hypothetical protein [Balneolaceae bacterium]
MKEFPFLLIFVLGISPALFSQPEFASETETEMPDPKVAFLRSLAVPGWGHYYVNPGDWTRGQYHLAGEAALVLSYFGFRLHSNNLEQNWFTYARMEAGVDIKGRDRSFQLAVGDFNKLEAYNELQERARNWDRFIADTPENRWHWRSDRDREWYADLRERFERIDQQLPALLSLMVVNRVVSAVSAYNRAKKATDPATSAAVHFSTYGEYGVVANLRFSF